MGNLVDTARHAGPVVLSGAEPTRAAHENRAAPEDRAGPGSGTAPGDDAAPAHCGRALRKLFETAAARCRGRTLLISAGDDGLAFTLRARGIALSDVSLDGPGHSPAAPPRHALPRPARPAGPRRGFATVIVDRVLERIPRSQHGELLGHAWARVAPGGRLIVVAHNADACLRTAGAGGLDRRRLRKLLRPLGRPELCTEQPFRWLVMYVERAGGRRRRVNRTRADRYRVTARLCRGRVIELGCGEGHLARRIRDHGHHVLGVDMSREKIMAAQHSYPEILFIRSDILRLELPAESFDTAVLAEVLEHVPDDVAESMLRVAWTLLRPGGRLIVSVPNGNCIPHPNHVREFDHRGLKAMLRPYGRPRLAVDQPFKWLLAYVDK